MPREEKVTTRSKCRIKRGVSEDLEDAWISSEDEDFDTDQDTDEEVNPNEINLEPGYYIVDHEKELFSGKVEEEQARNLVGFTVSCMQNFLAELSCLTWK